MLQKGKTVMLMSKNYKNITDEEIEKAYELLFNKKGSFDIEREKIIKSMESCYIESVPGSGKTTTLVTKLLILADKLSKGNYEKGICVLTHTNVGINIIKKKLGKKGDILFNYPNFIGTLQSFIDIYLAIPCYKEKFKKQVVIIDDNYVDKYNESLIIKNWKLKSFIKGTKQNPKNTNIEDIYFNFKEEKFCYGKNRTLLREATNDKYKTFYTRIEKGILKYSEAVQLGEIYLDKYSVLKEYFSERFSLILVDEMQDTKETAFEILETLFDKKKTIVQYIGDSNQNINNGTENWNKEESTIKYNMSSSKRFGENIQKFLNIKKHDDKIKGNQEIQDFKPILFLYNEKILLENEKNGDNVIFDKYIEVIKSRNLDMKEKPIFKVIGRIGKKRDEENKVSIYNYFKNFQSKSNPNKDLLFGTVKNRNNFQSSTKQIIHKIKNEMNYFLRKNKIEYGLNDILKDDKNKIELHLIIYNYLKRKNIDELNRRIDNFLEEKIEDKIDNKFNFEDKIFCKDEEENVYSENGIKLEIDTVNGVKGETHTATLYLETFFQKNDVENFFKDFFENKEIKKQAKERNNHLYVGCSRPKYLLCIACKNCDIITRYKEELKEIFEIINLGEEECQKN